MITSRKTILLLSLPLMLFLAGLECEDDCTKCEDAISHMADNIQAQACNPINMQKAWDGIREECDHFDSAVGMMAETCFTTELRVPNCGVPALNLADSNIFISLFLLDLNNLPFPFDISVHFINTIYTFGLDDFTPAGGPSFFVNDVALDEDIAEGYEIEFSVRNLETGEEVARESAIFTFARYNAWDIDRRVDFHYIKNPDEVRIEFLGW